MQRRLQNPVHAPTLLQSTAKCAKALKQKHLFALAETAAQAQKLEQSNYQTTHPTIQTARIRHIQLRLQQDQQLS
jgi:hypothetical protein